MDSRGPLESPRFIPPIVAPPFVIPPFVTAANCHTAICHIRQLSHCQLSYRQMSELQVVTAQNWFNSHLTLLGNGTYTNCPTAILPILHLTLRKIVSPPIVIQTKKKSAESLTAKCHSAECRPGNGFTP